VLIGAPVDVRLREAFGSVCCSLSVVVFREEVLRFVGGSYGSSYSSKYLR
jgi:hypothetical protein